jgi:non-homologous end joining protein Ku
MHRIEEKIEKGETKEITKPEAGEAAEPKSAKIIDLAALLKRSLDQGGAQRKTAPSRRPAKRRASKPKLRVVKSAAERAKPPPKRKRA